MMKRLYNQKAQATASEYVLIIFIAIAMAGAMMLYFRRAVQARIFNARNYMVKEVVGTIRANDLNVVGDLRMEYEPYYTETDAYFRRNTKDEHLLTPGHTSGVYKKTLNQEVIINAVSSTLPAHEVD